MSSQNDTSPITSLTLLVTTANSQSAKFQNLTSLISSEKIITDLADSYLLQHSSANGNITIFCKDEGQISQLINNLCLNHII